MSIAISALAATIAVLLALSSMASPQPAESMLTALFRFRQLPTESATTALLYCTVIYAAVFSAALVALRVVGLVLAAIGIPDEQQIRRRREMARQNAIQVELAKRQAKLLAHYMMRAEAMSRPVTQPSPRKQPRQQ